MPRRCTLFLGLATALLAAPDTLAQNSDGSPSVLSGSVVLPGGQPAAGATVWLLKGNADKPDRPLGMVTTDARGRFAFSDFDLQKVFDPQAGFPHLLARDGRGRLGWSATLWPNNWAELTHKIPLLDVGEVRGRLVDAAGAPIGNARLTPVALDLPEPNLPPRGHGWLFPELAREYDAETAADGTYVLHRLPTRAVVWATVTAPGFGSPRVRWQAAEPVTIRLEKAGSIRGTVTGAKDPRTTAGQPLAGVRVFNAGDAPQSGGTQTGADGTFRLGDLFVGPVYVFAEKAGYRFTGVRVPANGPPVTITLRKVGEPIPQPERPPRQRPFADDKRLARQLLEKLWALPPDLRTTGLRTILESMARLDPPQALRWAEQVGRPYPAIVRATAALDLAAAGPDEALTLLTQVDGDRAYQTLRDLTKRYAKADPAKALRFAEEAVVRARAQEQPARTASLAGMGALVRQLGKEEVGRKLIDEAADMAAKVGTDGRQQWVRGTVAAALAPYDLPRAFKLLEPIREGNIREHCLGEVAVALAPHDLPRALDLVAKLVKSSTRPDLVRPSIAYRLAAAQPDQAIQVVEGMDSFNATKMKAEGFAWLAVAVAPRDRKRAWWLIDRSLDIYLHQPEKLQGWGNVGGASALAARVAGQARQVGYPDMESVLYRILATRPPARHDSPACIAEADVATAMIFALADPILARQLLEAVEPRRHLIGTGFGSVGRKHWLLAWTLADPARAAKLFDEELAALKGQPQPSLDQSGLAAVVEILTTPPPERPYQLLRFYGGFSFPGED